MNRHGISVISQTYILGSVPFKRAHIVGIVMAVELEQGKESGPCWITGIYGPSSVFLFLY